MSNRRVRIAVLVSGGGTNLQALIDAGKKQKLKSGEIVLVVSDNPEAYALQRANQNDILTCVISKKQSGGQERFEERLISVLEENDIELIVLAGFLCILSENFTSRYPRRILNVHPSLIPSFCGKGFYGLRVHEAALARGVKVTGATVHFVNEIPDGGEIILQKAVAVSENETPQSLQQRVMRLAEWKIFPVATEKVCAEILAKEK
mgnify:CR=1 FL=1